MRAYLRHLDYMLLATAAAITTYGLWIVRNATRTAMRGLTVTHQSGLPHGDTSTTIEVCACRRPWTRQFSPLTRRAWSSYESAILFV